MKKLILMGRTGCGKTTLTQALKGEKICYHKTQYVNHFDVVIDTPGEYIETKHLGGALAVYSYEADVVGLLIAANEPFSLYPPNITSMVNREVVGIVTQIERPDARPDGQRAGCAFAGAKIFSLWIPLQAKESGRCWSIWRSRGTLCPGK